MTVQSQVKKELLNKISNASNETASKLLDFLNELEEKSKKERILSFSGIWKDLDADIITDLTEDLHKRRAEDIRLDR